MKNVRLTVDTNASGYGLVRKTLNAWIPAVTIDYVGTQACNVVIRKVLSDGFTRPILTVNSANTDIERALQRAAYDDTNTATGNHVMQSVGYMVEVEVSGATANVTGAVVVHLECEGSQE